MSIVLAAWSASAARAQDAIGTEDLLDISYIHSAVFGTGTYAVRGRRITMLRIPVSGTVREASADSLGWRWNAPVVLGYDDFSGVSSDLIEQLLPDNLVTLSVMPGVEMTRRMNERWHLKPFFELGGGQDFGAGETFALTHFGVRSLHVLDSGSVWATRFGAALRWAGEYQFDSKDKLGFGIVNLGVDVRRRLPWQVAEQGLDVGTYYLYERYLPRWTFGKAEDWVGRSRELHELGLSVGVAQGWKVLGFTIKRFRVGYKKGGKLQGWTFGTEFPF